MTKLKNIELIFENCTSCIVDSKYIKNMTINGVKSNKTFIYDISEFRISLECESLFLIIDKSIPDQDFNFDDSRTSVMKRIFRYNDIVYVILNYTDDSKKLIYMPWEDGIHEDNLIQSSKLTNSGDILIEISK